MATVFLVEPVRRGRSEAERERIFVESLVAIRLALGGLEGACEVDPARCRRAAAVLERFRHEVEYLSAQRDPYDDEGY